MCVTIGARGALLFVGPDAPRLVTGTPVPGTDTCGAGDSFAAAAAAALADGALPAEAVAQAVAAASRFVAAGGAAAFDPLALHGPGSDGPDGGPRRATRRPGWRASAPPAEPWSPPVAASTCCTPATSPPWRPPGLWATSSWSA